MAYILRFLSGRRTHRVGCGTDKPGVGRWVSVDSGNRAETHGATTGRKHLGIHPAILI